jgi:hypothetical protein
MLDRRDNRLKVAGNQTAQQKSISDIAACEPNLEFVQAVAQDVRFLQSSDRRLARRRPLLQHKTLQQNFNSSMGIVIWVLPNTFDLKT